MFVTPKCLGLMLTRLATWFAVAMLIAGVSQACAAERVVLQLRWVHQFQFAGYYAALEKGFYNEAGLNVEIRAAGPNRPTPLEEVANGHAQYGVGNAGLVVAYQQGQPVVALAAIFQRSANIWLTLDQSNIKSPQDLALKRLMMTPSVENAELLGLFANEGIERARLNIVPSSYNVADLIEGRVDAFNAYATNEPYLLKQQNIPYRIIDPHQFGIDFYSDVLFTSDRELQQHPQRVAAFRAASLRGWAYAMEHPEEIVDLILKRYNPDKTRDHLLFEASAIRDIMQPDLIQVGHMNPRRWEKISDTFVRLGMSNHNRPLDAFLYDRTPKPVPIWVVYALIAAIVVIAVSLVIAALLQRANRRLETATRSLLASEERLNMALSTAKQAWFDVDLTTGKVAVSPEYPRMIGFTPAEFESDVEHWMAQVHEEDLPSLKHAFEACIASGQPTTQAYRRKMKSGGWKWIESVGKIVERDKDGRARRMIGIHTDISFRKRRESALIESEQRFKAVFNQQFQFMAILSAEGCVLELNDLASETLGIEHAEYFGSFISDLPAWRDYPEWRDRWRQRLREAVALQAPVLAEDFYQSRDGSIRYADSATTAIFKPDGQLDVFIVQATDTTERRKAEQALRTNEELYRSILQTAIDGFWRVSLQGRLLEVNEAYCEMSGYSRDELLALAISDLEAVETETETIEHIQRIIDTGEDRFESRHRRKDGTVFDVQISVQYKTDHGGGFVVFIADISQRKHAEAALLESEATFKKLFADSADAILLINSSGLFVECNQAALDLLKMTREQFLLRPPSRISPEYQPDGQPSETLAQEMIALAYSKGLHRFDWTCVNAEGGEFIVEVSLMPVSIRGETMLHTTWRDVTERKKREAEVRQLNADLQSRQSSLQLAASVFTHAREGIAITDADANIINVNAAFTRITGYSREEVLGRNPRILQSGHQTKEFYQAMWQALTEVGYWEGEIWNRRKSGELYAEMINISAVCDEEGNPQRYVAMFSDITPMKEQQRQLEHIAHFDALTSLPNRVLLADRLKQAMAQCLRRNRSLAVVFLDLDGFKEVNDTLGHDQGDALLITVSQRMEAALRDGDTLSRLGGDEFVAILVDLDRSDDCVPVLERLLSAAAEPFDLGATAVQISASIGVTFFPHDGADAEQLLRHADQAMYQAKQAGKSHYHIFDAERDRNVRGRHESIQRIKQALQNGELVLYYQPKVNLSSGEMVGVEALIRWQHPERGLLLPAAFLLNIENHQLSVELGEWVIDTALKQLEIWQSQGVETTVSVNIAAYHLQHPAFVDRLSALLVAHPHILPERLELEVLESSAINDFGNVSEVIEICKEKGVGFALDDFGTGYSSLTYLKRLSAQVLKIDQSFVRDMLDDPEDLAILEGVLSLAAAFDRSVIAEGVECIEQGVALLQLGCEVAQGYVIAHPMPAAELPGWHEQWRPDPRWTNTQRLGHERVQVLFAGIEHRAWINRLTSFINGCRVEPPPLDQHQCRFGRWLNGNGKQYRHTHAELAASIEALHSEIHALANELLEQHRHGQVDETQAGLSQLHQLRDRLLAALQQLIH